MITGDGNNGDGFFLASHTYVGEGKYRIEVTVSDSLGRSKSTEIWIGLDRPPIPTPAPTPPPTATVLGSFQYGHGPIDIDFDGTHICVPHADDDAKTKIRAADSAKLGTFQVGRGPYTVIAGNQNTWVANSGGGTITKLSFDGEVLGTFPVGARPRGLAFDGNHLWVSDNDGVAKMSGATGEQMKRFDIPSPSRSFSTEKACGLGVCWSAGWSG